MIKNDFRQLCIKKLKICSKQNKLYKNKYIVNEILKVIKIEKPKHILLYIPLDMEVDVRSVINKLRKEYKCKVYVPYMVNKTLKAVPYRLPLNVKKYNIKEPKNSYTKYRLNLDLAIVPIIGTDITYRRIGFGVGFYDRFFSSLKKQPKIIFTQLCLCKYSQNITQMHDIKANYIITNKGTIWNK